MRGLNVNSNMTLIKLNVKRQMFQLKAAGWQVSAEFICRLVGKPSKTQHRQGVNGREGRDIPGNFSWWETTVSELCNRRQTGLEAAGVYYRYKEPCTAKLDSSISLETITPIQIESCLKSFQLQDCVRMSCAPLCTVCTHGGRRSISGHFLFCSSPYVLRQGLSLN